MSARVGGAHPGGYRPGGGAPRVRKPPGAKPVAKDIIADAKALNLQPLEYMLMVMNDPTAEEYRRDRMAIASAPYCHPRVADAVKGKKDQRAEEAERAGAQTPWAEDLGSNIPAN